MWTRSLKTNVFVWVVRHVQNEEFSTFPHVNLVSSNQIYSIFNQNQTNQTKITEFFEKIGKFLDLIENIREN
jgi:hypothetical protein